MNRTGPPSTAAQPPPTPRPKVIGEAILSLPPEECDRVFPQLYLPVMEEANVRVLRPHRKYLPTPGWFRFRKNMAALNAYLVGVVHERWAARKAGQRPEGGDILDRILAALEVGPGLRGLGGSVGLGAAAAAAACSQLPRPDPPPVSHPPSPQ
jgi:hypothetical protein